ncbi:MAG: glycosyltransferase family 39 protein [Propionibacteriales bacterium]|nr:glycosyltransferase family 39 protein [Propionibacteriales bacterium]
MSTNVHPLPPTVAGRTARILIPVAVFAAAFVVRLIPVLAGGGPYPVDNYDPSVYYAAAVGLGSGRIPYRDFLLLHPPGLLIFLQPFVAVGSVIGDQLANLVARVAFMVLGALTTVLIYRLLAVRGIVPGLLGAGFYLVFFPAIYSERTTRLEGLASFVVVWALVLLAPAVKRGQLGVARLLAAGALVGFGATVKIWGVVLVAAVCLWLWFSEGFRAALLAGVGALAVAVAVIGPSAIMAPQFWRMVLFDQLGRPELPVGPWERLGDIVGLGQWDPSAPMLVDGRFVITGGGPPVVAQTILLSLVLLAAVAALASRLGRLYLALAVVAIITLLAGPSWFVHYPTFSAAPLALVLGTGLAELTERIPRAARAVIGAVVVFAIGAAGFAQLQIPEGKAFPVAEVRTALADRPGCVTTDNPVSLIVTDTLRRNLDRGCPLVVDLSGYVYDISHADGSTPERLRNEKFQTFMVDYLGSGSTAVIMRLWPGSFDAASQAKVRSWPVLIHFYDRHTVRNTLPGR